MVYAVIENNVVSNIIEFASPSAASTFQNVVYIEEKPVKIGDSYIDGKFYHDGEEVISDSERLSQMETIFNILYEGEPQEETD